ITGSYDPDLDVTYWGVAQAKPWMAASRGNSALDRALYTSSTLALDPNSGALKWYYQHSPGESLDLDEVFERVLVDTGGEKIVFTIGKPGILWKLNRVSGKYNDHRETLLQNIFDRIDPETGQPREPCLPAVSSPRGGVEFVGDVRREFKAVDVQDGEILWQTRLGTSVQGFPITFSVGGRQYVAVSTGVGGGSPRNVPSLIAPE